MIRQLTIQNFGLIDRISLDFSEGLNILTGETGAGKSILIDAIRWALGERLSSSAAREPDKPCFVEVVFELSPALLKQSAVFEEYIPSAEEPLLIISRSYSAEKSGINKINGLTVTTRQLKTLGDHLVDFHGPHDHQMLFGENSHIEILDKLCVFKGLKNVYAEKYAEYLSLRAKLKDIEDIAGSRERELDILAAQIKELEQVPLEEDKYFELVKDSTRVNNSEKLYERANELKNILDDENTGISSAIAEAFSKIRDLNRTDPSTEVFTEILGRVQEDVSVLSSDISAYTENISFSPEHAREINRKIDIYYELLRKYGPSIGDAHDFWVKAKEKYSFLEDSDINSAELRDKIGRAERELESLAEKITFERISSARKLKKTIESELKELGIGSVIFEARVEKSGLNARGQDKVVFYISPNMGEKLRPLAEIVSSGEAARVMLALKKALIKADPIPVLIFDEIDAQIGGRLGTVTGKKLKELSSARQVLLITHLPQIASFGDRHFKIKKIIKDGRSLSTADIISEKERVMELAKMMSGENQSKISVEHASAMLREAQDI